jgi:cyclopropane-fatty-acyl-phospholipid synthase
MDMRAVMDAILKRFVLHGVFRLRWPDGTMSVHAGDREGPDVTVAVRDWSVVRGMIFNPSVAIGEAYMDGGLQPVGCTIYELLELLLTNMEDKDSVQPVLALQGWLDRMVRRISQWNPVWRSIRNVAHHYNIDGRVYELFLDADRQYSCAYFPTGRETIDEAQLAKKRHIAKKLILDRPGLRVLDVGSGWGGMALHLAREHGAKVTGITLSTEQYEAATARAAAEGLSDQVEFRMLDYRALHEQFDRIVSVGMFEHVGVGHYGDFFAMLKRSLTPDGVALLHSIGRSQGPGSTARWFTKYIFPGGYAPALSEVMPPVERSGLVATDIEIWRLHYARTLRLWRAKFAENRDAILAMHDEAFCRMFEFYLAGSELAFHLTGQMVFQIQLARDQRAVPLSRDYMAGTTRAAASERQEEFVRATIAT